MIWAIRSSLVPPVGFALVRLLKEVGSLTYLFVTLTQLPFEVTGSSELDFECLFALHLGFKRNLGF